MEAMEQMKLDILKARIGNAEYEVDADAGRRRDRAACALPCGASFARPPRRWTVLEPFGHGPALETG
jgi:hypothetical protein